VSKARDCNVAGWYRVGGHRLQFYATDAEIAEWLQEVLLRKVSSRSPAKGPFPRSKRRFRMRAMEELTSQQLSALARVSNLLAEADIDYWLIGGWAVDFYAGSVTRAHDDLDLAVWLVDLPRIAELLQGDGWRHAPLNDEDGGTGYERGAVRLELTYLVRDGDGLVFTPLRHGRAEWSAEALANDVGELRGVRSRLVGLAPLMRGKSSPRDDPEEAAKDRADFEQLSRLGT
jgi:hypothetical protein